LLSDLVTLKTLIVNHASNPHITIVCLGINPQL
jgi:hypothetical protein